jgi:hypothetical protein
MVGVRDMAVSLDGFDGFMEIPHACTPILILIHFSQLPRAE